MHFNSLSFLIFYIFFTLIFFLVKTSKKQVNLALIGSYIFYLLNGILSLLFLLVLTSITYFGASNLSHRTKDRKKWLIIFIILIVFLIGLSKYISSAATIGYEISILGISFYSLQAISLLIDVYNKKYTDSLHFREIGLFLSFFPQAVAGPIHRANELIPQFSSVKKFSPARAYKATRLILYGFLFKLIVADKIGLIIDPVFTKWSSYDGFLTFVSMHLYSLQIYFDFWGYSLIAIGLGHLLGYNLKINFNYPYSVSSFKLFWRRWHISLSQWMRDYVYLPLGGKNKQSQLRFILAINITFIISAVWHGIQLNFILWAIIHASLYISEDYIRKHISSSNSLSKINSNRVISILKKIIFFNLLSITWLVFRTGDFKDLIKIIHFTSNIDTWTFVNLRLLLTPQNTIYISIVFFVIYLSKKMMQPLQNVQSTILSSQNAKCLDFIMVTVSLILLLLFGDLGNREFLYFSF